MARERPTGWIGIDVGTSTVKVAQLSRRGGHWHMTTAIVPRREPWPALLPDGSTASSSLDELRAARSLEPRFRGRAAACTLPMTLCDVHAFDGLNPAAANAEATLRRRIETATQQSTAPLEIAFWPAAQGDAVAPAGWTNVCTLVRTWGDQLCDDTARAGWSCQLIDGLPFALARAARLAGGESTASPVAVLDWGFSRATLCVVVDGHPSYVRCLKNAGFQQVIDSLADSLAITPLEGTSLLVDRGLGDLESGVTTGTWELIHDAIAGHLEHLADEVARSLEHFQYQRRTSGPRSLLLLGGGATVKRLDQFLSRRLELPVSPWRLPANDDGADDTDVADHCLFATAAALSAISLTRRQGARS